MKSRKLKSLLLIIFLNFSVNPTILRAFGQGESWIQLWDSGDVDICQGLTIDSLDNVYVVGHAKNNTILLKYNSSGNLIWNRAWTIYPTSWASATCTDSLNNIYITGLMKGQGEGESDIFILKYNSSGNLVWNRTWGGQKDEWCSAIAVDSLDNIYIVGSTNGSGGMEYDMLLLKYNSSGNLVFNYTWGDAPNEFCHGLAIDSSDNIYISCYTDNWISHESKSILIKCDTSGKFQWNQTWDQLWNGEVSLCAVDSFGNIIVKNSDLLVKFNNSGTELWHTNEYGKVIQAEDIILDSQDNIYITGYYLGGCNNSYGITCFYMALDIYNSSRTLEDKKLCYRSNSIGSAIALDSLGNFYIAGVTWTSSTLTQNIVLLKNPTDYIENDGINYNFFFWIVSFGVLCIGIIIYILINSKYRKRKLEPFSSKSLQIW